MLRQHGKNQVADATTCRAHLEIMISGLDPSRENGSEHMRIVVCCGVFPAVSETFVTSEVIGLERRGHTVTVVAEQLDERACASLPAGGPSGGVFSLGLPGRHEGALLSNRLVVAWKTLLNTPRFVRADSHPYRYLARGVRWYGAMAAEAYRLAAGIPKADLVHAHWANTALWARAIALRHNASLIVTSHGYDATIFPGEFGWESYRSLFEYPVATFVAHSPFIADILRKSLKVDPVLIPLGVDTRLFTPEQSRLRRSRQTATPKLAFVGRLSARKGARVAIETLALLNTRDASKTGLAARLDIVGDGPQSSVLESVMCALQVKSSVVMHGALRPHAVAEVLRRADFLLAPSVTEARGSEEAFGLVCLEAQACGALVIGTLCGGIPYSISPPVGGQCVGQHSPVAMANAIRSLWFRNDWDSRCASARARVLAEHSMNVYIEGYERLFASASQREANSITYVEGESNTWRPCLPVVPELSSSEVGSIPAYICGRKVVDIRRRQDDQLRFNHHLARSITIMDPAGIKEAASLSTDLLVDVILDLDGAEPDEVILISSMFNRMLRPGGFAVIAVQSTASSLKRLCRGLRGDFSRVVLLDSLFTPGPKGGVQEITSEGLDDPVQRGAVPFRHLLCLR